jgi:putative ABC transport system ATP-binding protein
LPLISVRNLTKIYDVGDVKVHALRGLTLDIERGEFVSIVGPSGSGKSTLMHILGCLDRPTSGTYELNGRDVSRLSDDELSAIRNEQIGFVFQGFNLLPRTTALENVELPLLYTQRGRAQAAERRRRALDALAAVGLQDRAQHHPNQLSGGQQQRVAVARAIAGSPLILLADEPTGNLDSVNGEAVMGLLQDLHRAGATICMVTHDPRFAKHAGRTIHLFDGRVVEEEKGEERAHSEEELKESGYRVS